MRVESRHISRKGANKKFNEINFQPQGKSSGWKKVNYGVVRGFLHWKVISQ